MTSHVQLKSWLILQDCITALQMLGKAVDTPDGERRVTVLWVAAVTMLRAVGHVLQKVDAANNPAGLHGKEHGSFSSQSATVTRR